MKKIRTEAGWVQMLSNDITVLCTTGNVYLRSDRGVKLRVQLSSRALGGASRPQSACSQEQLRSVSQKGLESNEKENKKEAHTSSSVGVGFSCVRTAYT